MGKYDFIKNESIVPVHKNLKVTYESGYGGEKKELDINVYPYTVEEKLELELSTKKYSEMLKSDDDAIKKEAIKLTNEATVKSVWYVLKKDDPSVTIKDVEKLPDIWYNDIIMAALEFEGITKEQLQDIKEKKDLNKL